jgi:hypothetical protein
LKSDNVPTFTAKNTLPSSKPHMKNILSIALLAVSVAACDPGYQTVGSAPIDPCNTVTYNDLACQQAISANGYYYSGTWFPVVYSHPYGYYHTHYNTFIVRGGRVRSVPSNYYSRSYSSPNRSMTVRSSSPSFGSSPTRSMTVRSSSPSYSRPSSSFSRPSSSSRSMTVRSSGRRR